MSRACQGLRGRETPRRLRDRPRSRRSTRGARGDGGRTVGWRGTRHPHVRSPRHSPIRANATHVLHASVHHSLYNNMLCSCRWQRLGSLVDHALAFSVHQRLALLGRHIPVPQVHQLLVHPVRHVLVPLASQLLVPQVSESLVRPCLTAVDLWRRKTERPAHSAVSWPWAGRASLSASPDAGA